MSVLILIAGLVLLLGGGDLLVRGASGLARSWGVSSLVIGLTVVAFGTSAPELVVNLVGAWNGQLDLAFGNIVGSNLANLGLILGLAALVRPLTVRSILIRREIPMACLAVAAAAVVILDPELRDGAPAQVDRVDGLVLLLFFGVFIYYTVSETFRKPRKAEREELEEGLQEMELPVGQKGIPRNLVFCLLGFVGLVAGAEFTVRAGSDLARAVGIPEVIIGMTVVAVGTSLPELAATAMATLKGEADLAVGNVVGSNIFNTLLVLGATSALAPIDVPPGGRVDVAVVLGLSLFLLILARTDERRLVRWEGGVFLVSYLGYVAWRCLA